MPGIFRQILLLLLLAGANVLAQSPPAVINGPLRRLAANPNYFTDNTGNAIFLTGSHTWENFQDIYSEENLPKFDWPEYLTMMEIRHHNFMRFWVWEHPAGAS